MCFQISLSKDFCNRKNKKRLSTRIRSGLQPTEGRYSLFTDTG